MSDNAILRSKKLPAFRKRFERKFVRLGPDDCWMWLGKPQPGVGYGRIRLDGHVCRSHRAAWLFSQGEIPMLTATRSMSVCHSCDNRLCVNPAHLWLGSDSDNANDRAAKGRTAQGAAHYRAKLTPDQVRAIRLDRRPIRVVALDYGVTNGTIWWTRQPGAWKSVE